MSLVKDHQLKKVTKERMSRVRGHHLKVTKERMNRVRGEEGDKGEDEPSQRSPTEEGDKGEDEPSQASPESNTDVPPTCEEEFACVS